MSDKEQLKSVLKKLAEDGWAADSQPVLLSNIPPMLHEAITDPDYKKLLGSTSLKSFIKATGEEAGYQLIEHPIKSAKVAIAPLNVNFEFDDVDAPARASKTANVKSSARATLAFLKALETLSEEEQAKIAIPVSVLIKLLR